MNEQQRLNKLDNGSDTARWAAARIRELKQWIEQEAEIISTCTRNILGEKCKDCLCKFKDS